MSPTAALLIFASYIAWLLVSDVKRREGLSIHLWVPVLWVALVGSRPVTSWFSGGPSSDDLARSYDEGNSIERMVYLVLIFYALCVLIRRNVRLGAFAKANLWLLIFFLYWLCSVFWADSSLIAFKRWFKDVGHVVMSLVILTEANPAEASKAVFARVAAVLAPVSLLLIKYFPDQGRVYHVTGEMLMTGVATHKNSLGVMLLVCGMFMLWDWFTNKSRRTLASASLVALMTWLLVESKSATSIVCAAFGALIFVIFRSAFAQRHLFKLETVVLISAMVVLTDSGSDLLRYLIVDILGRDLTFTTRTDFWPMLIAMNPSDMFGSGFGSFWTGERLEQLYKNYRIVQAHNGYLETYLNGGFIALALLIVLLLSAMTSANRALTRNEPFGAIRMVFVLITIIYSVTEASFNTLSILWFAFLLNTVRYSNACVAAALPAVRADSPIEEWRPHEVMRGKL